MRNLSIVCDEPDRGSKKKRSSGRAIKLAIKRPTLDNPLLISGRASAGHLPFLDGLRGLAALYVAMGHAYQVYFMEVSRYTPVRFGALEFFGGGKQAVALFIVLSGFCLMMPVVKSEDVQLRGGAWRYIKRRAWRILPPYYAAMGISLAMIALLPAMQRTDGKFLNMAQPAFGADVILSHLFLVYNLHATWIYKINPPFWSVATEWQIYFLFPLILLPMWRRTGAIGAVAVGLAIGLAPHFLLYRTAFSISNAHPWFLGLFAMGMAAAGACFAPKRGWVLETLWKWAGTITIGFIAAAVLLGLLTTWHKDKQLPFDVLAGFAAMALLVWCEKSRRQRSGRGLLFGFLESTPVAFLGAISYSLYLMHVPILFVVHRWSEPWHTSPQAAIWIMYGIGMPVAVAACALFHYAFERPFVNAGRRVVARPAPVNFETALAKAA